MKVLSATSSCVPYGQPPVQPAVLSVLVLGTTRAWFCHFCYHSQVVHNYQLIFFLYIYIYIAVCLDDQKLFPHV
jgi:hypothetical protein